MHPVFERTSIRKTNYMKKLATLRFFTIAFSKTRLFFVLLVSVLMISCEEDFEINAPYQDITIAYGLIDPSDDTIFVKINKAFLGDGDILEMARIEDSSNYINNLMAVIEEWDGGNLVRTYQLDTITIKNKEEGTFYNPYQVVYFTPYEPVTSRLYRLKINVNNKEVTATTSLINDFTVSKPSAGSKFIQFRKGTDSDVEWVSAKYGKRYEVLIRFKYKEVLFSSPDTVYKQVDWFLATKKALDDRGGDDMSVAYRNDGFYTLIGDKIPYQDAAKESDVKARYTNDVDFMIAVAATEYNTYMEVNEPTNSIVQDRPDYTNISNGLGIFSSRYRIVRTKKVHAETIEVIQTDLPQLKFVY